MSGSGYRGGVGWFSEDCGVSEVFSLFVAAVFFPQGLFYGYGRRRDGGCDGVL